MGRLRSHRKIKAVDPFNPKRAAGKADEKTEALPAEAKGALLDETGLPKKLQRIMRRKEVTAKLQEKERQQKQRNKDGNDADGDDTSRGQGRRHGNKDAGLPTQLPGESALDYDRRLETAAAALMHERLRQTRRVRESRRESVAIDAHNSFLAERKKKKKEKLRRLRTGEDADRPPVAATDRTGSASAGRTAATDPVRFGEVAKDIPHFTALPRGRKAAPPGDGSGTAASKRILETERQRVIDHYRKLKLSRQLLVGTT